MSKGLRDPLLRQEPSLSQDRDWRSPREPRKVTKVKKFGKWRRDFSHPFPGPDSQLGT